MDERLIYYISWAKDVQNFILLFFVDLPFMLSINAAFQNLIC